MYNIYFTSYVYLQLLSVHQPNRMEGHAMDMPTLTVTVPEATQGPTARTEVHTTEYMLTAEELCHIYSLYICFLVSLQCLQFPAVHQCVRLEEHAMLLLTLLTVSVPVGIQDPTARTVVCTSRNTHTAIMDS